MAILVTGGSKGIGLQIALSFSQPGNHVFLNHASDDVAAAEAKQAVEARGAHCHVLKGDAGTPEGCRKILQSVAAQVDRLDQLVHCAVRAVAKPPWNATLMSSPRRSARRCFTSRRQPCRCSAAAVRSFSSPAGAPALSSPTMPPSASPNRSPNPWCAIWQPNWRRTVSASTASRPVIPP